MSDPVVVTVDDAAPVTISPGTVEQVLVDVGAPAPVTVDVTTTAAPVVQVEAVEPVLVDVSTLGAPGARGEQGPTGPREVYLDDEPVDPAATAWLRVTRDPDGAVTGIYYGEA